MKPGDLLELELSDLSYLGGAVGRTADNRAAFVQGGLPGERVKAAVEDERRSFVRARVVEVLRPAPERVTPECPSFGVCGGCQWQHLAYAGHLHWKTELVRRQLRRIGHFADPPVRATIAAPHPWAYRNQARFTLDARGRLGYHQAQSHDLVQVEQCAILLPELQTLMPRLQGALPGGPSIVARYGARSGQYLIAPRLTSLEGTLETGQPFYEEIFLGQTYRVSEGSFFQVNTRVDPTPRLDLQASVAGPPPDLTRPWGPSEDTWATWFGEAGSRDVSQAELLALLVLDRLELTGSEMVVDAYSGVGTFARLVARRARRVVGIEEAPSAVQDARVNLRGIDHATVLLGRSEDRMGDLPEQPDAVILDPPRAGANSRVLKALEAWRPSSLVYVSCDPATLARDLAELTKSAFELVDVQPLDMFPQTHHVETVSLLRPKGSPLA